MGQEQTKITVDDVRKETIFSWYNCNPMYALKAAYHLRDLGVSNWENPLPFDEQAMNATYYRPGKEYHFFCKDQQTRVLEKMTDSLEFETWLEWLLKNMTAVCS